MIAKTISRIALGLAGVCVAAGLAGAEDAPAEAPAGTVVFAGLEWRGMALASHLSHGPGMRVGVGLWRDRVRVGVVGASRPGPINGETFDLALPAGVTYKGKDRLALRSDGQFVGLFVAPVIRLGRLELELPLAVGQFGAGFYLTGEDRDTPDGRRVSAWENELMDGRDSSIVIGLEAGARVAFRLRPWIQPYAGVHYMIAPGYDAFVVDSYDGASVVGGVQLGAFR